VVITDYNNLTKTISIAANQVSSFATDVMVAELADDCRCRPKTVQIANIVFASSLGYGSTIKAEEYPYSGMARNFFARPFRLYCTGAAIALTLRVSPASLLPISRVAICRLSDFLERLKFRS
jgi:hypothetical protein